jgi:hypothetical protein
MTANQLLPILITALITIIGGLMGIIGYFLKINFDSTDRVSTKIDRISEDVADMKPKVEYLWKKSAMEKI